MISTMSLKFSCHLCLMKPSGLPAGAPRSLMENRLYSALWDLMNRYNRRALKSRSGTSRFQGTVSSPTSFFFFNKFYWNTVDLESCVSFGCTAKLYIYMFLFRFFPHIDYYSVLSRLTYAIH